MVTVVAFLTTDAISKSSPERVRVHDHVAGAGMHRAFAVNGRLSHLRQILGNANAAVRVLVHCEQNARLRTDDHDVRSADRALQIVRVAVEPCDGAVPAVVDALRRLELIDGFRPSYAESIVLPTCSRSWPSSSDVDHAGVRVAILVRSLGFDVHIAMHLEHAVSIVIGPYGEGVTDE